QHRGFDGAVGRRELHDLAVADVQALGRLRMDFYQGMPGELSDRILILQQPGLVGAAAVVEQRAHVRHEPELAVALRRRTLDLERQLDCQRDRGWRRSRAVDPAPPEGLAPEVVEARSAALLACDCLPP